MKKIFELINKYGVYLLIVACLFLGLLSLKFKNATLDDDLYLWETSIMTEALSRGQWFGDYSVGTHGFLFKLPVAIIFLFTGPSLVIATVWNVLLACISLYIFYLILKHFFPKGIYPFLGTFLLLCNFQFILNLPTYMREFPVFLSLLLLIYFLVKKKSYWLISLALLLIFDAKEYVLFMIVPALIVYIAILEWKGFTFNTLILCTKAYVKIFSLPIILLLLMIFTSIVPLNMYGLSIVPGVTKGGIEYQVRHFNPSVSTTNRMKDASDIQQEIVPQDSILQKGYKVVVSYIGKILYPRTFSFLSIPKIIFLPAFLTSIIYFKSYLTRKRYPYIAMSLLFYSFISIFVLRASFDRYLFPILPVVVFFFLIFLKDLVLEKKKFLLVVALTSVFALLGLLFETDYILFKLLLNIFVILMYIFYVTYHQRFKNIYIYVILVLGCITFSVVGFFFYANGQLRQYILWGNDFEIQEVVTYFDDEDIIMLNDVGWDILPKVYRGDNRYDPQWKWELQDWIPRKKDIKMFEKFTTYNISGRSIDDDIVSVQNYGIQKIGLMVSTLDDETFRYQDRLEQYLSSDWLSLIETVKLKNKKLYIFEVL